MINSFHFLCVELHLSLFCTISTVTVHRSVLRAASILVDNPEKVPGLDGSVRFETISCILHNLACIRTSSECLVRFSCSLALGVLQQARMVVHPDSKSGAERQAVHLSKLQSGPRRALDRVQIIQVSYHNVFFCMETSTQPRAQVPPLRHDTSWNLRSNSEHRRCTEWQEHPSMSTSLQSLKEQIRHHSPHGICSRCPLRARQSTETPASGRR